MIELRVADYCHDCPDFEPETSTTTTRVPSDLCGGRVVQLRTVVTCVNANRYNAITNYLAAEVQRKSLSTRDTIVSDGPRY